MNILQVAIFAIAVVLANARKPEVVRASANIAPDCKREFAYKVHGTVDMVQKVRGGNTYFTVKLEGFPPNTYHGFHVHQSGDIHTRGCLSAGGHYNPFGKTHGGPKDRIRHVGDLGNVKADSEGAVSITIVDKLAGLVGKHSIAGRSFVVHAMKDDLGRGIGAAREGSLKTGNAGARVACGIIFYK